MVGSCVVWPGNSYRDGHDHAPVVGAVGDVWDDALIAGAQRNFRACANLQVPICVDKDPPGAWKCVKVLLERVHNAAFLGGGSDGDWRWYAGLGCMVYTHCQPTCSCLQEGTATALPQHAASLDVGDLEADTRLALGGARGNEIQVGQLNLGVPVRQTHAKALCNVV